VIYERVNPAYDKYGSPPHLISCHHVLMSSHQHLTSSPHHHPARALPPRYGSKLLALGWHSQWLLARWAAGVHGFAIDAHALVPPSILPFPPNETGLLHQV
jgi:hypothetical protein